MCANNRFGVEVERDSVFDAEAYVLRDHQHGSSARVIPSLGNNLMSFVAMLGNGQPLEVMLGAPASEQPDRASRWGNPILFPFPNRVRDARYSFQGKQYQLAVNTLEGNHIHGVVRDAPWRVEEGAGTNDGAMLRCSFMSLDNPEAMLQYPFPFVLTVTYTLVGNKLRCQAQARNTGVDPMPMGFGIHPYFRLPLGEGGRREDCLVYVPARRMWEQDAEKLPTGRLIPVPPELDFTTMRPLDGVYVDHVYTDISREGGEAVCRLRDPHARVEASVRFGAEFPDVVTLVPADRSTIAFEPYTCVTDAINLAQKRDDTGLVILQSGESWQGGITFEVEDVN